MRGQDEEHGQGVRPQDTQQVGDAEAGGDCLLPGGARRAGVRGPALDHQPSLRLSRQHKPCECQQHTWLQDIGIVWDCSQSSVGVRGQDALCIVQPCLFLCSTAQLKRKAKNITLMPMNCLLRFDPKL